MSFRFATCVSNAARAFHARAKSFVRSSAGNIAMSFAILAVPTVIAIKQVDNLDDVVIPENIVEWLANKPMILAHAIEDYVHPEHGRHPLGSSDLFIQASSASEIQTGLSHVFTEYLTNVRLTD